MCNLHDIGKIGIPDGLKGAEISVGARIIAICDSIDAMTSTRRYRKALGFDICYQEIEKNLGKMYDPVIGRFVLDNWDKVLLFYKGGRIIDEKYGGIVLFAAVFLIAAMGFYDDHAKAAEKNITLYNGSSDANDWEDGDIYHVGDYGKIELQMNWYSMVEIARKEFHSSNEKTATVDAAGNFRIVGGGKTFITAKGWDAAGNECFSASYELFAAGDMSKTRLQTTTVKMYQAGWNYDDEGLQVRIPLVDAPDLTYYAMSYRWQIPRCGLPASLILQRRN